MVPKVTQLSSDPPMWRVSDFMSEGEMAYLKEAYSPTFTSCFPGAPETLVWWLGRWASWGSIRVCQEMNQDLDRGMGHGNEVMEAIEMRVLDKLRGAGLYSGEDGRGSGFYSDQMDMQLVRYRRGGKFRYHFDEDPFGNALPMTFMVYLSDKVEHGGGGTSFPRANGEKGLVVDPIKGDALVWSTCGARIKGGTMHDYGPLNGSYHSGLEVEGPYDEVRL